MKKVIETNQAPAAIGPYVQAMAFGDLVMTSGQLPINPQTGEMPESVADQTAQSLKNIAAILAAEGLTPGDVMKTTVFLKDMNTFAEMNEVYGQFFEAYGYPARSCVEVARLPKDARVEIEIIASRK